MPLSVLNFQDDILTVIRRVDENWAEGMLGDKIGIFPISYVEVRKLKRVFKVKMSPSIGGSSAKIL